MRPRTTPTATSSPWSDRRSTVQSDFSRHAVGFNVFSRVGRYFQETKEDYWDYGIEGNGRLDITQNNNLQGGFGVARLHDARDDPEDDATVAESVRPVRFMNYDANLAYNHLFNRVTFRVTGVFDRNDYRQGAGTADQNDRDRNIYTGLLRVGYNVSPRINTFVEGLYDVQRRDVHRDSDGFERDSNGWGARTGVDVNFTDLLFGEAFVGYRTEYFDDSAFDTESGVNYGVNLTWLPTQLTTVTADRRQRFPADHQRGRLEQLPDHGRAAGGPRAAAQHADRRRGRLRPQRLREHQRHGQPLRRGRRHHLSHQPALLGRGGVRLHHARLRRRGERVRPQSSSP